MNSQHGNPSDGSKCGAIPPGMTADGFFVDYAPATGGLTVDPLTTHQLTMPFLQRFRLKKANDCTEAGCRLFRCRFELVARTAGVSFSTLESRTGLSNRRSTMSNCWRNNSRVAGAHYCAQAPSELLVIVSHQAARAIHLQLKNNPCCRCTAVSWR